MNDRESLADSQQPGGRDVLLAFLIFALLLLAILLAARVLLGGGASAGGSESRLWLTAFLLLQQNLAMLAAIGVAGLVSGRRLRPLLGLVPLPPGRIALAAALGLAVGLALGLLLQVLQFLLDRPVQAPGMELLAPAGFSWTGLLLMLAVAGVLAPLCEELMFRGLLFGWLRQRLPVLAAAALSALPFGLLHVSFDHIVYATTAGFLLALLYQRFGSLWAAIAAHAVNNSMAVLLLYLDLAWDGSGPAAMG